MTFHAFVYEVRNITGAALIEAIERFKFSHGRTFSMWVRWVQIEKVVILCFCR